MGENKKIRKQIAGHERNIQKHLDKIKLELEKKYPSQRDLKKWREIDIPKALHEIEKLKRKLPGGGK